MPGDFFCSRLTFISYGIFMSGLWLRMNTCSSLSVDR